MPNPADTREIDSELRAEIEAAYAGIESQPVVDDSAELAVDTKIQPFMKSLKADAVVDLTEQARAQSYDPNRLYQAKIEQARAYTNYINDLRDWTLENR